MQPPPSKRHKTTEHTVPTDESFRNMQLRTVIRENHNSSINKVRFNKILPSGAVALNCANLVACIGANELNIYDNFHCGKNFLDLFCNFVHKIPKENPRDLPTDEERHTAGAPLTCLAWVSKPTPEHTNLAVGTQDGETKAPARLAMVNHEDGGHSPMPRLATAYKVTAVGVQHE